MSEHLAYNSSKPPPFNMLKKLSINSTKKNNYDKQNFPAGVTLPERDTFIDKSIPTGTLSKHNLYDYKLFEDSKEKTGGKRIIRKNTKTKPKSSKKTKVVKPTKTSKKSVKTTKETKPVKHVTKTKAAKPTKKAKTQAKSAKKTS